MNKLKTLKDLRFDFEYGDQGSLILNETGTDVMAEDLRQEAIKWCKYNLKMSETYYLKGEIENVVRTMAVDSWIKHFFNITEGDLK